MEHRDDIQALRAIAVIAVIIFHLNKTWLPGGFLGVDIFFVISGFLMTKIILKGKNTGNFSFISFYTARIRRIVPAYFILLAVVSPFMGVLLIPTDFRSFDESLKAAFYFNSNNFFANDADYFAPVSYERPLLHTWSLSVEMQFYLALPALLMAIPDRRLLLTLTSALLISILYAVLLTNKHPDAAYFALAARAPEFLIGTVLAARPIGESLSVRQANYASAVGLVLIFSSFILITEDLPFPGPLAVIPCLGTALVIGSKSSTLNRKLSIAPLVMIGALSYSLYLWHWPILAGLRYFLETYTLPLDAIVFCLAATLIAAYLSYRFIEIPFRNRENTGNRMRWAALAVPSVIATYSSKPMNHAMVPPLPLEFSRYADPKDICHAQIVQNCLKGEPSAKPAILLIGDSHAAHLNHFADVIGKSISASIRVITASSCVNIEGFDLGRIADWAKEQCRAQTMHAKQFLGTVDTIIIGGMWQFHAQSQGFMRALDEFLSSAKQRGQRVIILSQIPMLTSNPRRAYRFQQLGLGRNNRQERDDWKLANNAIRDIANRHTNTTFLDLSSLPLFENRPFAEGTLIYQDEHHLNEVGSKMYGKAAQEIIRRYIVMPTDTTAAAPPMEY